MVHIQVLTSIHTVQSLSTVIGMQPIVLKVAIYTPRQQFNKSSLLEDSRIVNQVMSVSESRVRFFVELRVKQVALIIVRRQTLTVWFRLRIVRNEAEDFSNLSKLRVYNDVDWPLVSGHSHMYHIEWPPVSGHSHTYVVDWPLVSGHSHMYHIEWPLVSGHSHT